MKGEKRKVKDNRGARFPVSEGRRQRSGRPWSVASLARLMQSETEERCLGAKAERIGRVRRCHIATRRRSQRCSWDLLALRHISHISRISPIRYQRSALEDAPRRGYVSTVLRSYGVAEGVATGEFFAAGVAVGFASSLRAALGDGTGVALTSGVADEIGLTETSGLADASEVAAGCGVTLAAGVLEALAVGLGKPVVGLGTALVFGATGAGFVFLSSFSRRPVLRSELCLAVKIVRRRVTPKNIPPR